jgi:preprotein translocase SecE subunit
MSQEDLKTQDKKALKEEKMAKKRQEREERKQLRLEEKAKQKKKHGAGSVFSKEYKYEGLILLILSIVSLVLGTLVLLGHSGKDGLTIPSYVWLIGTYPKLMAWILIGLAVIGLILSVIPFFKPSVEEFKRVTWLTGSQLLKNTGIVVTFVIIMALFFFVADLGLAQVVRFFNWLAGKM